MQNQVRFFDSLKKTITVLDDSPFRVYICGPTVYDHSHLGHGRMLIIFDILHRFLKSLGPVTFVMNITDIDDKIINKALEKKTTPEVISKEYYGYFHSIRKSLNILPPDYEPKATEYIEEMIKYIQVLLDKKCAYITHSGIYFDTTSINYGFFEIKTDTQNRVEVENKKNEKDFALWKFKKDFAFHSPWGMGRPGWHLECSTMSGKILGEEFHIHGGGCDLKFPHHENEIAQSIGFSGKNQAKIWMHNGMIKIKGEKMSKSLKNFTFIKDFICNRFESDIFRYLVLTVHYGNDMEINDELWQKSLTSMENLRCFYFKYVYQKDIKKDKNYTNPLGENLDTPSSLSLLHLFVREKNIQKFAHLCDLLGFFMEPRIPMEEKDIQKTISQIKELKRLKNYEQSDKLRNQLSEKGVKIIDNGKDINWIFI